VTDSGGRLRVTIPETGAFIICAGSPQNSLLSSCRWSSTIPTVQIPSGNRTVTRTATLQTGITPYFRFNDPSGLLSRPNNAATGVVSVGVWDPRGIFTQAYPVSSDSQGFNYEVVVPLNMALHLNAQGTGVSVLDTTGAVVGNALAAIPDGSRTSIQSLASKAAVVRVFTVTAKIL
jgi:hypothetical protein